MFDDLMIDAEKWQDAECANEKYDPELWFDIHTEQQAKAICRTCPLVVMCAEYALSENISDGIWGALNATDRRALWGRRSSSRLGRPDKVPRQIK